MFLISQILSSEISCLCLYRFGAEYILMDMEYQPPTAACIKPPRLLFLFALLCMHCMFTLSDVTNRSFDIVYISLDRHLHRATRLENMLLYKNCSFWGFNAVDGEELLKNTKSINDYTDGIRILPTDGSIRHRITKENAGMAGRHLSHLIILQGIASSDSDRPILILEDDIDLDVDFVEKIEKVLVDRELNRKWELIMLGAMFEKYWLYHPCPDLAGGIYQGCLHAYLVNGAKTAKQLVKILDTGNIPGAHIDTSIAELAKSNPGFRIYCFKTMIAVQRRDLFESTITPVVYEFFFTEIQRFLPQPEYLRRLYNSLDNRVTYASLI
ncbi:hypothetical protein NEDG_02240 [Nematocida displodere]|uniref:Glycosyl transferase family 25 domain-containing protein n=1 Tax=Nematocida displodere TaxID=1805483 RepID=A0A177EKP4_9MICR|nr:hypothetical protein NEDG_02240 [Nematocida displodere]